MGVYLTTHAFDKPWQVADSSTSGRAGEQCCHALLAVSAILGRPEAGVKDYTVPRVPEDCTLKVVSQVLRLSSHLRIAVISAAMAPTAVMRPLALGAPATLCTMNGFTFPKGNSAATRRFCAVVMQPLWQLVTSSFDSLTAVQRGPHNTVGVPHMQAAISSCTREPTGELLHTTFGRSPANRNHNKRACITS